MLQLFIMRHGMAEATTGDDASRPLTPEGIETLEGQARALTQAGLHLDIILTSPLLRAVQTASIIAAPSHLLVSKEPLLKPGACLEDVAELVSVYSSHRRIMLVGHQPDMSRLIQGLTGAQVRMRTGMLAWVETPRISAGAGMLMGLYDPDILLVLSKRTR